MKALTYTVRLQRDGVMRAKYENVPAQECGISGNYHNGKPYSPNTVQVGALLPYRYRKAFWRDGAGWWQDKHAVGNSMPLTRYMYDLRGNPMGTLVATPDWV